MPDAVKIVRGKIVGGVRDAFLIAVDDNWGRIFDIVTGRLSSMIPLGTAVRQNPEAFGIPFDGDEDQEQQILDAAQAYDELEPQLGGYDLPAVDIIDRD